MKQWLKKKIQQVFTCATVPLQHEFHITTKNAINKVLANTKYEIQREQLINHILHNTRRGIAPEKYVDHSIIVSLTSYGKRIHEVALAIESLMQQTMKANRIVLWLDKSFQNQLLPRSLILQQQRGLEIEYCTDIGPYMKLIPQMRKTPDDAIITVDDDVIYDFDLLEHLILAYQKDKTKIHCCRVHKMLFCPDGNIMPYNKWESRCVKLGTDKHYFLTGVGAVLYPPHCLDEEVLNEKVFAEICPKADDVWFTAMALKKGTPINKVFTRNPHGEDYIEIPYSLEEGLSHENVEQGGNDRQLKAVFEKYSLYDKLI